MSVVRIVVSENTDGCWWGWDPKGRHYGACVCNRKVGHLGRCRCDCDSQSQRPADWDAKGRAEANR